MARRSVLQVVQPPDGGVAEHVALLSEGLVARGWDVTVATVPQTTIADRLRAAGVAVHLMDMAREPRPSDAGSARALRALDRRLAADVVHAHSSKAGILARAALPRARRLVYTPNCPAFLSGMDAPRRALSRVLEQAMVPRSGAIVACCEWERDAMAATLRGSASRLHVIHNRVPEPPPAQPDPRLVKFADGLPLAGLVAVLRPQKDPLMLVRAAARMREQRSRIAIVGEGPMAEPVAAEIARLGVSERIALLSYGGSMAPHLRALDVFVLPSRWEAFPLAVLEAMQLGLPVAATRVGGVGEAVADGISGRLLAAGDERGLTAALDELLGDGLLRRRLGDAGRRIVRERFALDGMITAAEALYEGLAGAPGAGGRSA